MRAAFWVFAGACAIAGVAIACGNDTFAGSGDASDSGDDRSNDGNAIADATDGVEASANSDGACPSTADLCDDFESDAFPAPVWGQSSGAPASLALSTTQAHSPTHSVQFASDSDGGNPTSASALLTHTFEGRVLGLDCAFSMWIDEMPTGIQNTIVEFVLLPNTGSGVQTFVAYPTINTSGTFLNGGGFWLDGGQFEAVQSASPLPTLRWVRVDFAVDFDTKSAKLSADGSQLAQIDTVTPIPDDNGVQLLLGLKDNFAATSYFIDDVVCTARH